MDQTPRKLNPRKASPTRVNGNVTWMRIRRVLVISHHTFLNARQEDREVDSFAGAMDSEGPHLFIVES